MSFNLCGVKIKVEFLFFATLALSLCVGGTNGVLLSLCASAIHELGHLLAMAACKKRPACISFCAVGASIAMSDCCDSPYKADFFIYIAGAAANIITFLLTFLLFGLNNFALINLFLAAFNMLPVFPLDGAGALKCILFLNFKLCFAEKLLRVIYAVTLFFIAFAVFAVTVKYKTNYSLWLICVYLCFCACKYG